MSSDWFDPELFAALCSPDLAGALDRIGKYVKLIAPIHIGVVRGPVDSTVTIDFIDPTMTPPVVFLAFKLVFFVQLARLATRTAIRPLRVGLPLKSVSEEDEDKYAAHFGVAVIDAPRATLTFANQDMDRPFLTENHKMWLFFEPSLRQRLADLDRSASMLERVRSTLLECIPAGEVSVQAISRKLAVSTRTLQRRLQEEGTSFQQILDELRSSLAHHYLRNTHMSGAEISFLLGFEDSNSFAGAFATAPAPLPLRTPLPRSSPSWGRHLMFFFRTSFNLYKIGRAPAGTGPPHGWMPASTTLTG